MNFVAARVLCVEFDQAVLDSRCAVLKHSGYDLVSASPQGAEIVLRSQKFDLIVVSALSDHDLHRIINFSDGADVLVVDVLTPPAALIYLVKERLGRRQLRA
jgi:CheY-like chemotaxis protein